MQQMKLLASTVVVAQICDVHHNNSGWYTALHVITMIFGCATVLGNGTVLVAYYNSGPNSDTRRMIQNVYILNLAISDFSVGLVVMLPYAIYMLVGSTWLPQWLLVLWNTAGQLLLYQRLYVTVLLSFDRYIMVSNPARYRGSESIKRAWVRCIAAWLLNLTVATAAEVWFLLAMRKGNDCAEASNPWQHYQLFGLGIEWLLLLVFMLDFCLPFFLLTLFNTLVFLKLREGALRRLKSSANNFYNMTSNSEDGNAERNTNISVISDGRVKKGRGYRTETSTNSKTGENDNYVMDQDITLKRSASVHDLHQDSATDLYSFTERYMVKKAKLENKRLKSTAIRLLTFVIVLAVCWMPCFVVGIVSAFKGFPDNLQTAERVLTLFLWSNSAVDPFLYFAINRHLRRDIRKQLRCIDRT